MYLCISSVFSSECTWLLLRSVPTAPPDVWHVILLDHMVASADAVLYIPSPLRGRKVLNTSGDGAYVLLDVFFDGGGLLLIMLGD